MLIQRIAHRQPAVVAQSWKRIEKWLEQHLPESLADLRPGLSKADILKFEELIGQQLPEDVRESYQLHDGQEGQRTKYRPGVIFGCELLPLNAGRAKTPGGRDVFLSWKSWAKLADRQKDADVDPIGEEITEYPPDTVCDGYANRGWIPLHDSDSNCFGVDLDPGPNGMFGQVITFGRNEREKCVLALSWAHFLEDVADELEAGNFIIGRDPNEGRPFCIKESEHGCYYNMYRRWSEAKLPVSFQNVEQVEHEVVVAPPIIQGKTAHACAALVETFIHAMHKYELHWLKVRPLDELGLFALEESERGWGVHPIPQFSGEGSCSDSMICDPMTGTPDVPAMIADMRNRAKKDGERYQIGVFREEAVAQKKQIFARFCTARPREQDNHFVQADPPTYDPARCQVSEVREAGPDCVLVVMEPEDRIVFHQEQAVTVRYRLKKTDEAWRIDLREESTDGIHFKKVSLGGGLPLGHRLS